MSAPTGSAPSAGDEVAVTCGVHAQGRGGGLALDQRLTQWWTARDGQAVRVRVYLDRLDALAAADLA